MPAVLAALVLGLAALPALAAPVDWQMGFQPAGSVLRERIDSLHNELLVIITLITLFVLALLVYVMVRFNAKRNPTPSRTSHNTVIEIAWTAIPVLILVFVAVPSFKLLYFEDRIPPADLTLKVTGHQWYWSYEYPDQAGLAFDSYMVPDDQIKPGQIRLLDVDNPVVLPVGATVRVLVAGSDVIHSWFLPPLGVQVYSVVGRTNERWLKIDKEGTYYGQCNQICGVNHPFMPIEIKAVSKADFDKWVQDAKKKFARNDTAPEGAPLRLAAAPAAQ